jgi:integrase
MVACERNPPIIRENPFNKQLTRELSSLFSTQVKAEHRHVTLEEFDRMMAKVDPQYPFIRGIMACCRLAATRYVEAHDLRWEDIDYERGCLAIRGKLDEQGREFSTTKRSRRTVPMSAKLAEILRSIPKDQRAGPCEANVTLKTVYRLLDKAREDAGIDDYGKQTHALRASCINDWMDADHTLANIAEWAGHSLDVMMTHYRERGSDRRIEGFHQKDKG